MSAEEAKTALDKAEAAWVKAKQSGKKDAAYLKAQAALIEARDEYRTNYRESAGAATPEPVNAEAN